MAVVVKMCCAYIHQGLKKQNAPSGLGHWAAESTACNGVKFSLSYDTQQDSRSQDVLCMYHGRAKEAESSGTRLLTQQPVMPPNSMFSAHMQISSRT